MENYCDETERRLVEIIRHQGPISAGELGGYLHLGQQHVRAVISHLRREHFIPICSTSQSGFYWPKAPEDIRRTEAHIKSRIKVMEEVVDGLRLGSSQVFGPPALFDVTEYMELEREAV
ncbi:MAG: hypothetical protein AB1384_12560 [Actinomycetota bacterium]